MFSFRSGKNLALILDNKYLFLLDMSYILQMKGRSFFERAYDKQIKSTCSRCVEPKFSKAVRCFGNLLIKNVLFSLFEIQIIFFALDSIFLIGRYIIVNNNVLLILVTLYDPQNSSHAPNIVGVSDINLLSNFEFLNP